MLRADPAICKTRASGSPFHVARCLQGSAWNYGASATNDMGGFDASTSSPAKHGGEAAGMFGSFGVDYTYGPTLCPGTAGSVCAC